MFGFGISFEAGQLLADEAIDLATYDKDKTMAMGLMKRVIDYDSNYQLKKYSRSKMERAILSLYIFSKEQETQAYLELRRAVKNYATNNGINANFKKIDDSFKCINGQNYWDP